MSMKRFLIGAALITFSAPVIGAETLRLAMPDPQPVLAADADAGRKSSARFAVAIPIDVTPQSHGTWLRADGVSTWQLDIEVAGALNLNLGFSKFRLPPATVLTVVGNNGNELTFGRDQDLQGQLWTPVVSGDRVRISLTGPSDVASEAQFLLHAVNAGFRPFHAGEQSTAKAASCHVNAACDRGAWSRERRSVARITATGVLYCTASLLNNTAGDRTPLLLTANHCVATPAQAAATVVYWKHEASSCSGFGHDPGIFQVGAVLLATSARNDFTLMRLIADPPPEADAYFSGWDKRAQQWTSVTGLHHPANGARRISHFAGTTDFAGVTVSAYSEPDFVGSQVSPVFHYIPSWTKGMVEGGSSGSGLWNAQHRLVGQLSGSVAECTGSSTSRGASWYGRFDLNWTDAPTPATSVAIWLDPLGTGEQFVDGVEAAGDSVKQVPAEGAGDQAPGAGGSMAVMALSFLMLLAALKSFRLRAPVCAPCGVVCGDRTGAARSA